MTGQLSRTLQHTINAHDGGPVELPGDTGSYVVMSMDVFREMLAVMSEDEQSGLRQALERGLTDVRSGRVRPLADVLRDLSLTA